MGVHVPRFPSGRSSDIRILVTGSRNWNNVGLIWDVIDDLDTLHGSDHVLVSGACPLGADAIAETAAREFGWEVERHPANWSQGKRAGFIRNEEMVNLGADLCIAFVKFCRNHRERHGSHGSMHTVMLAEQAGIEVQLWKDGW